MGLDQDALNQTSSVIIQAAIKVHSYYEGLQLDGGYRIDLLVEDSVIVEVKSTEKVLPVHNAQLLSYLRLLNKRLGLLINFNTTRVVYGIKRVVNHF
jgi:GxxExxY protein